MKPEERKTRIAQIILAIPMLFFMYLAFHGIFDDYKNLVVEPARLLKARTAQAEGIVVDSQEYYGGKGVRGYRGSVLFTTASGQQVKFQMASLGYDQRNGTKMQVAYDPDHPDNASYVGDHGWSIMDMVFMRGWGAFLGVLFLIPIIKLEQISKRSC